MSSQPPPEEKTTPESTPEVGAAKAKPKKPRSKAERIIVWGAIGVLLVVAGFQALEWYHFKQSYGKIAAAIKDADLSAALNSEVDLQEAEAMMSGFRTKSEVRLANTDRYIVYTWPGVYINYRVLLTISDADGDEAPLVLDVMKNTVSPEMAPAVADDAEAELDSSRRRLNPSGGAPGPPGSGPPPGGPGPPRPHLPSDDVDLPSNPKAARRPSAEPDAPSETEKAPAEAAKKEAE